MSSVRRTSTWGAAGATVGRLLRSRWIARVCRTELGFFFEAGFCCGVIQGIIPAPPWSHRPGQTTETLNLGQMMLGYIARERFKEAKAPGKPHDELLHHLNTALKYYHQALDLQSPDEVNGLAVKHHQLGNIYDDAGDL